MKKKVINKKIIITVIIAISFILDFQFGSNNKTIITEYNFKNSNNLISNEYSDLYKEWLALSEEDRLRVPEPPKYVSEFVSKKQYFNANLYTPFGTSSTLPSKYDLRDVDGKSYVTSVKNQGQTNLCWSFASAGALESNILVNGGNAYDFSAFHTSNALAFQFSDYYNPYGSKEINYYMGGNFDDALKYWTSGLGPVTTFSGNGVDAISSSNTLIETSDIKVKEAYRLPYFDINEHTSSDLTEHINNIKTEIMENGGVGFSGAAPDNAEGYTLTLDDGSTYSCANPYNEDNYSVYTDNAYDYQCRPHMMLIVGWDDNYSKDNFNAGTQSGNKPSQNGAWIVKNSWGDGCYDLEERILWISQSAVNGGYYDGVSDVPRYLAIRNLKSNGYTIDETNNTACLDYNGGYVYYSYEDYNLNRWIEVVSETSTKDYDNIYQYNPTGEQTSYYSSLGAINVFDKSKDVELLEEVSFYLRKKTDGNDKDVGYKIYVNSSNGDIDEDNMTLVKSQSNAFSDNGYYTVQLDNPIELSGEQFVVKVVLENAVVSIATKANNMFSNDESVGIIENQGYIIFGDKDIRDAATYADAAVQIKAFTSKKEDSSNVKVNTVIKNQNIDFPISNQKITLKSITNNIPSSTVLEYKIKDSDNNDVTSKFNIENNIVINNLGISILGLTSKVEQDIYTIETIYNNQVLDSDILSLVDFDIKTDKYNISDNLIIPKIKDKLIFNDFIKDFTVNSNIVTKVFNNDTEIDYSKSLGTGYKLKTYSNDELINEYTLVVSGDINSDGQANASDILYIKRHILGKSTLKDVLFTAGDINESNSVNATDIMYVKRYILGKTNNVWGDI